MLAMHLIITRPPQQLEPLPVFPCASQPPGSQDGGNEALPKYTRFNKLNLYFELRLADRLTCNSNTPGSQSESVSMLFPSSWFQHRRKQRDVRWGGHVSGDGCLGWT